MYFRKLLSENNFVENSENISKHASIQIKNGVIYDGEWKGKSREGFGILNWPDGAKYEGEWKDNQAHGKGKFYYPNGDVFEGIF